MIRTGWGLLTGAAVLGVARGAFTGGRVRVTRALGAQTAIALGNARLYGEVTAREPKLRQEIHTFRIEIDESQKARQVAEITETEYFQTLQQKARALRERRSG